MAVRYILATSVRIGDTLMVSRDEYKEDLDIEAPMVEGYLAIIADFREADLVSFQVDEIHWEGRARVVVSGKIVTRNRDKSRQPVVTLKMWHLDKVGRIATPPLMDRI